MRQQPELLVDFGKHKGKQVAQLDDAYLQWMLKSFSESSQWQKAAANALTAREADQTICNDLLTSLKSCTLRRDVDRGRRIHAQAVESRNDSNAYVVTALIRMYAKCGSMVDARQAFDRAQNPNVVSWTALLLGYAENGQELTCLELFSRMKADGCVPDSVTYVAALKACTSLAANGKAKEQALNLGTEIHSEIGEHLNTYVQNMLIDMYAKCGTMIIAQKVFDSIQQPDVVSWNALLFGYADNGEGRISLELFVKMKAAGYAPNTLTYVAALKGCISLALNGDGNGGLEMGSKIHLEIGDHLNPRLQNTLMDMYTKCGSMVDAQNVFDCIGKHDVVTWTALILGYADNGEGHVSLAMFSKMKADGCIPDSVTYVAVLRACTSLAVNGDASRGFEMGRQIHSEIGDRSNLNVENALIDMYAKCGSMADAHMVFESIEKPNVVSWTALIQGYAENGEGHASLELFSKMKAGGCLPNSVTYVAALKACTSLAVNADKTGKAQLLETGRDIHSEVGDNPNTYVQGTLIDMYANCGSIRDARQLFDSIHEPDVLSWTALISGYAENGESHISLELFSKMKDAGCVPDSVTYVALLKACALAGALALGRKLHSEISEFTVHLVTCLIDFYAKCGSMEEARAAFDQYPKTRDVRTWTVLLAGYSSFGDTASVFSLFEVMQDTGVQPDSVTFVCLLLCCSHAGLVSKARQYLEAMPVQYGVTPNVFHYSCMIDVLGRANQLFEAVSLLRRFPFNPNAATWNALLGACCKWKNLEIGRMAFQSLLEIDKGASAYAPMAQIFCSHSVWEEQSRGWKLAAPAYVADATGKIVKFVVGQQDPPEVAETLALLLGGTQEQDLVDEATVRDVLLLHMPS